MCSARWLFDAFLGKACTYALVQGDIGPRLPELMERWRDANKTELPWADCAQADRRLHEGLYDAFATREVRYMESPASDLHTCT